jgi:hypothetical protein
MLTRKDYKTIARIIQTHHAPQDTFPVKTAVWQIAQDLADYMIGDNPRFDYQKFMQACNLEITPPS